MARTKTRHRAHGFHWIVCEGCDSFVRVPIHRLRLCNACFSNDGPENEVDDFSDVLEKLQRYLDAHDLRRRLVCHGRRRKRRVSVARLK